MPGPERMIGSGTFMEHAALRVAWKIGLYHRGILTGTAEDFCSTRGLSRFQFGEAVAQPAGIQHGDGERSDAALRATHATCKMVPTAARGFGEGRIDDVEQEPVGRI